MISTYWWVIFPNYLPVQIRRALESWRWLKSFRFQMLEWIAITAERIWATHESSLLGEFLAYLQMLKELNHLKYVVLCAVVECALRSAVAGKKMKMVCCWSTTHVSKTYEQVLGERRNSARMLRSVALFSAALSHYLQIKGERLGCESRIKIQVYCWLSVAKTN